MNTQTDPSPRRSFRERIDGLMDHVLMQLDMGSTARHEQQYLKTGNLLGAAGKLLDALQAQPDSQTIEGCTATFVMEAGVWDQTQTLQRIAEEQGVTCKIELKGNHTAVDLTGADRTTMVHFINEVINQAVKELKDMGTYESAEWPSSQAKQFGLAA